MNNILMTALMVLVTASVDAYGSAGLQSQEVVNGSNRYCRYSDGSVLTVNSIDSCPIDNSSVSSDGSSSSNVKNNNVGFGSLNGQKVDGSNRYCLYTDGTVLTIGSTEICPNTNK